MPSTSLRPAFLLVDDEPLNLEILSEYLADEVGFALQTATGGETAWDLLRDPANQFKLILLDRVMPGLDGIGLLRRIKADPRLAEIPVIMQTAANSAAQIREGLEAGAFYYLSKPYRRDKLLAIVHAALFDAETRSQLQQQLRAQLNALQFLQAGQFTIRHLSEARQLASLIAQACPDPDSAVLGIAEILINSIEHGNLGLNYAEKSQLKLENRWQEELARRATLPENLAKTVQLEFERHRDRIILRISDQGAGFAWQNYLEIDPQRAADPNGRGIALARLLSFSKLTYERNGSVAVITIDQPSGAHMQ